MRILNTPYFSHPRLFFFKVGDYIYNTRMFERLSVLKEADHWSAEQIYTLQQDFLHTLIRTAYKYTPFWKAHFDSSSLSPDDIQNRSDLSILPVLTKSDLRENLDALTNLSHPLKNLTLEHSSGSTGEPVSFYSNRDHYGWRRASMFHFWQWAGYAFGEKWLRVSSWKRNSIKDHLWDIGSNCAYVSLFEFSPKKMREFKRKLEKFKPRIIRGYSGALYLIADYLKKTNSSYDFIKAIITTGDILFPHFRKTIEQVFNARIFDTYGAEGSSIAGQCEYGNYHVDDLNVILEIVDDEYKPLSAGNMGRILITDLHNLAMPFIRYEIGDLGISANRECPCGRRFSIMEQPQGRDTDIIFLSNGNFLIVHFFTILFEFYKEIRQFQIIETGKDQIQLNLVVDKQFNNHIMQEIKSKITQGAGCGIQIQENIVDDIPVSRSGKRRFVIGLKDSP